MKFAKFNWMFSGTDMIKAELLTETTELHFKRMLFMSNYGFQEKHNGHRLMIAKQDRKLSWFNREGEVSSKNMHPHVRAALLAHPLSSFVIDGELVKNTFYIFDALVLGDEVLNHDQYDYREARYHQAFEHFSSQVKVVVTARTPEEKRLLWDAVLASHGEGIVSKGMDKTYKQGRADQHWKLKFTKECDVVVMGLSPEGKDSVEIGVYDERGQLHRVSGCSLRGKFRVAVGEVLTVRYLYSTRENHIVQPVLIRKRTDKKADTCDIHQLVKNKNFLVSK